MEERKGISKSMRFTDSVTSYIESKPGNSFNEKFDNLVNYFIKHEKALTANIKVKEAYLKKLEQRTQAAEKAIINLEYAVQQLEALNDGIGKLTNYVKDQENMICKG